MTITPAELDRRFDLHTPTDQAVRDTLDSVRADFKRLAAVVIDATSQAPREQSIAVHHLEDALAATIGAIVRPASGPPPGRAHTLKPDGRGAGMRVCTKCDRTEPTEAEPCVPRSAG